MLLTGWITTEFAMAFASSCVGAGPTDFQVVMEDFSDTQFMQSLKFLYFGQITCYFVTLVLHLLTLLFQPAFKRMQDLLTFFYICVLILQLVFLIQELTALTFIKHRYEVTPF